MRHVMLVMALVIGVAAAAGQAAAAPGAPVKVCKNLMGKVIPCAPAKPMMAKPVFVAKPAPPAAKPGLMSHFAGLGHPTAPPPPPQVAKPPFHAPSPAMASAGGSQTSRVGATAKCKDGSYWRSKSHSGACSRHNGVAAFY